ncbi:MAG TPA: aminotransferase class V-fold PLP-dependent enzyme [Candidatus Binatia bacterium]|nr:aminotransferase class V-fold PLP-dependent enzyme [Candidatus Binatia bacterium]
MKENRLDNAISSLNPIAMIYLDCNATTPVLPEVLDAMLPYFTSEWGDPSSTYKFGYKTKTAIDTLLD